MALPGKGLRPLTCNLPGAFTARATVADGRGGSATATTVVRVASLSGAWDGQIQHAPGSVSRATRFTLIVTHSGQSLAGIWSDNGGTASQAAPGFVTSPFTVTFSCESCPSNASTDFIIRGTPSISPNAPSRPGFDVFNMISGTCAGPNSARSFVMTRR